MGNSDQKPENPQENNQPQQNKPEEKKKEQPYPIINSGRKSKPSENRKSRNDTEIKKNKSTEKRPSSPLQNIKNLNEPKDRENPSKLSKRKMQPQREQQMSSEKQNVQSDVDNQFMQMLKLPQIGSAPLNICLIELKPLQRPKPCISRNYSEYSTILQWKMDPQTNIYRFGLRGEPINLDVDLQGNVLNRQYDLWAVLCPLDLMFNERIKVGQYNCAHFYRKMENQQQQDETISPSMKNIELGIEENLYSKWGQSVPEYVYEHLERKKQKRQRFIEYKEINKYFSKENAWKMSVFIEESKTNMRVWIIKEDNAKQTERLEKIVLKNIRDRQKYYMQTMIQKMKNI